MDQAFFGLGPIWAAVASCQLARHVPQHGLLATLLLKCHVVCCAQSAAGTVGSWLSSILNFYIGLFVRLVMMAETALNALIPGELQCLEAEVTSACLCGT